MPPSCTHNITFTHVEITYDIHTHSHTPFHTKDGIYGLKMLEWKVRQIYKSLTPESCGRKRRPSAHPLWLPHVDVDTHMHICMHAHIHMHTHIHIQMHACVHTHVNTHKMNRIRKRRERERKPFYVKQHHKRMGTQVLTGHPIWSSLNLVLTSLLDFRLPSSMAA